MLNIANYLRNANQNYNEVSPQTGQNGQNPQHWPQPNAGEDVEQRELSFTAAGNAKDRKSVV